MGTAAPGALIVLTSLHLCVSWAESLPLSKCQKWGPEAVYRVSMGIHTHIHIYIYRNPKDVLGREEEGNPSFNLDLNGKTWFALEVRFQKRKE